MAKFNPPKELDFTKAGECWPQWKQRFLRYATASKLRTENGEIQVNNLIYLMGQDAETIYQSFALQGNDATNFQTVIDKFDAYFVPKKNIIHERAMFY
jgi:hypothetical protein